MLKDLDIKGCYESGVDDIIELFYEPALSSAVKYDRIAGFFSSSALAVAARGLAPFIASGGKMRLIASPNLDPADKSVIEKFASDPDLVTPEELSFKIDVLENEFQRNHVKALGWMLANDYLEIKLAVVVNNSGYPCSPNEIVRSGLFHQKVGILTDCTNNKISFSGSINETASAWINNDEEFKVFKSWDSSCSYFEKDQQRFEEMWEGKRSNLRLYNLPSAVKEQLIVYSSDFTSESISLESYQNYKRTKSSSEIPLFPYQKDAVELWKNNDYKLLFQMATGTGKTRTAIAGIHYLLHSVERLMVVVSTPQGTLSKQWKEEVEKLHVKFDQSSIIDGTVVGWKNRLESIMLNIITGLSSNGIIYTTHTTSSSSKFTELVKQYQQEKINFLFVGDEAHWLGAQKLKNALLPQYRYRIGLSATPSRWFDDYGTLVLQEYFGSKEFEYSIKEALTNINPITGKHFLVNYYYNISKVQLTEEETDNYRKITKKLVALSGLKDRDEESAKRYNLLLTRRAEILKNAENKYAELETILDNIQKEGPLENLLIFVSTQQIERVEEILRSKRIPFNRLTEKQKNTPDKKYLGKTERQFIIDNFKKQICKVIVAIKCLDEGIDIPVASRGILMASGTNPREYIQRIGRIIRQSDNKDFAHLYDICVEKTSNISIDEERIESSIRKKECARLEEIAENAINSVSATKVITSLK